MLLVAQLLARSGREGQIAVPVTATGLVEEVVAGSSLSVVRTPHSVSELTRAATRDGVVLAAAPTGGFVFPDVVPGYDAVTALCKVLELLAPEQEPLSTLVAALPRPTLLHRAVPCPWGRKGLVMRLLNEQLASRRLDLMDGVKAYDDRGWVQVLPDRGRARRPRLRGGRDARALGGARGRGLRLGRGDRAGRRGRAANRGASLKLRLTPLRWGCFNRFSLPGRKVPS